jgi:hypothetical protein
MKTMVIIAAIMTGFTVSVASSRCTLDEGGGRD